MDNDADTQELGSGQWLLVNPTSSPEPKPEEKVDDEHRETLYSYNYSIGNIGTHYLFFFSLIEKYFGTVATTTT